jgi:CBS domain-containing protein
MKRNEPISHIMSTGLITVHHGDPVSKARKLIRDHGVHHLPVVKGHEIVGIISSSDILRVSFGDAFGADERAVDATLDHTLTLEQIMQPSPRTLQKDMFIRDAAEILSKGEFHSVPIVDTDGKTLVGMVTSTDLIRYLLDQF